MQFTTSFIASLLAASTSALPPTKRTTVDPGAPVTWSIANFDIGCSPGGCAYNFDIASYGSQGVYSSFSTHCTGTETGNDSYQACEDTELQSVVKATTESETSYWQLFVERLVPQPVMPPVSEIISGNVTFPLINGGEKQSAEMLAYSYGVIATSP